MEPEIWAVLISIAAGILFGVYRGLVKFGRWAVDRAVEQFTENLQEQWKADIEDALTIAVEPILHELSYNEGRSVKDMVRRIERSVEELHAR